MGQNLPKALANGALLSTSACCLRNCKKNLRYAKACFRLYFLMSAVTLFNLYIDVPLLFKIEKVVWVWSYALGLPLLISDLTAGSVCVPDISPIHLLVPVYTILLYHSFPGKTDSVLLGISHTISLFFLTVNVIYEREYCGIAMSFLHLLAMFRLQVKGDPQTTWAILMALSNVLALESIKYP